MDSALHGSHGATVGAAREPGIGKTRLADALFDLAAERGSAAEGAGIDFGTGRVAVRGSLANGLLAARSFEQRCSATCCASPGGGSHYRPFAGGGEPETAIECPISRQPSLDLLDPCRSGATRRHYERWPQRAR